MVFIAFCFGRTRFISFQQTRTGQRLEDQMESMKRDRRNILVLQRILKEYPWLWAVCKSWDNQKIKIRDANKADLENIIPGLIHPAAFLKVELWDKDTLFSQGVYILNANYDASAKLGYFIDSFPIQFGQFDLGPNLTLKKTHVVLVTSQGYIILRPPEGQKSF